MSDLKFALRQLLKNPGFTAIAVFTLALGIGANTAIFSVINAVLLRPLPYPQPDRLVTLWERAPENGIDQQRVSGPNYLDWRAKNTVFSDMAVSPGWDDSDFNLVLPEATVGVHGTFASSSLFTTFGGAPLLGRAFLAEEDQKGANRVAVLGYELWQRRFAGNSNVLGRKLTVDKYGRHDYAVVGVMPPGFGSPGACELWLPLGWMGVTLDERRSAHWHNVVARLKPGVSLDQARAQMNAIQAQMKEAYPADRIGSEVAIVPLVDQAVGRSFRTALFVLWGVVAGALLIACANVVNLTLVRMVARQRELAIRLSLGAGRWRLIRQLLTESVLLSLIGGGLGTLFAHWGLKLLVATGPANIPRLADVSLDAATLVVTLTTALVVGLIFGLMPAWQSSRLDLNMITKETGGGTSAGNPSKWIREALVVTEVAMAMVLLIGTGLMLQSFARLLSTDLGYRSEQVVTADLDFSVAGFTTWAQPTATRPQIALRTLLDRVRHLPGVQSAGAAYRFLRKDSQPPGQTFVVHGRPMPALGDRATTEVNAVTPDYLKTIGVPLLRGRNFNETDTLQAPGVAQVSESFVRRYFPNQEPLGQHITMVESPGPLGSKDQFGVAIWCEIVGVVGDVKSLAIPPETAPEVYRPYWQYPMESPTLVVRGEGNTVALVSSIRQTVKGVVPNLPDPIVLPFAQRVHESVARPRFETGLLSLFGILALLLAACGIYGVLAASVALRQREIGIRMALGARTGNVIGLVLGQGLRLTFLGLVLGIAMALVLTRFVRSLLYEVVPNDPLTFMAVSAVMAIVALLACWLPARRATRIHLTEALRHE